jgi:ubiquinone/menaquinone biosynthesis C-methylase UbiE
MRSGSFGENHKLTMIDKLGIFLSSHKIIDFVRKNKPQRIVDIGCGFNATTLLKLKPYSKNLTGIDTKINPDLQGILKIETIISDNLSFLEDSSADLVILNSVLEHLVYPQEILKEIYRVLDKNGMAIINVPNWMGKYFLELMAFKLRLSPAKEMNDHKIYYNKKDIWPMLVRVGFQPIDIKIKYHKLFLNTICYAKK